MNFSKNKIIIALLLSGAFFMAACDNKIVEQEQQCAKPEMVVGLKRAPMAVSMRQMYDQMLAAKRTLERGTFVSDSLPKEAFWTLTPTDSTVLVSDFFERANAWEITKNKLMAHPKVDTTMYNAVISSCISCHQEYCVGPIKKIKKLYF